MGNQVKPVRCLLAGVGHGWLHCIGHVLSPSDPCRTSGEVRIQEPKIILKVALEWGNLGTWYLTLILVNRFMTCKIIWYQYSAKNSTSWVDVFYPRGFYLGLSWVDVFYPGALNWGFYGLIFLPWGLSWVDVFLPWGTLSWAFMSRCCLHHGILSGAFTGRYFNPGAFIWGFHGKVYTVLD